MCIRVQYVPRHSIEDPYDASRLVITLPDELRGCYAMRALRAVLTQLDIAQPASGARCWCGEQIGLLPIIPQQRSNEVIHLGA